VANPRCATAKIMGDIVCKTFLLSKLGWLDTATLETPLGPFMQTHDNHHVWQTGTNTIDENMYLFNVHYRAQQTRHQIKVNQSDKLHNAQPIMHGHPIMMQQATKNT
jgi:hypothetical protein